MSESKLILGDCFDVLPTLEAESFTAVVTDPPYGFRFMGQAWDGADIEARARSQARKTTSREYARSDDGRRYQLDGHDSPAQAAGSYDFSTSANRAFQEWTTLWARECLRLLKPGGLLLAFGGPRTYHRLAAGIEDAGFEIRDCMLWLFASGFPKSLDVSKAIDRQRHDRDEVYRVTAWIREARDAAGLGNRDIDAAFGFNGMASHWTSSTSQPAVPTLDQVPLLLEVLGVDEVPEEVRELLVDLNGRKGEPGADWWRRPKVGESKGVDTSSSRLGFAGAVYGGESATRTIDVTRPASSLATEWEGYGTALAPAYEPIVLAMKPLDGTFANNAAAHGVAGIHVDGARMAAHGGSPTIARRMSAVRADRTRTRPGAYDRPLQDRTSPERYTEERPGEAIGRWPKNLLLSCACEREHEPSCPVGMLDEQAGDRPSGRLTAANQARGGFAGAKSCYGTAARGGVGEYDANDGTASRFFYCAKTSREERELGLRGRLPCATCGGLDTATHETESGHVLPCRRNVHPTVKPADVLRYLLRLLRMPGGATRVLDPFVGSGSTLVAAAREGIDCVGIEREEDYVRVAAARVEGDAGELFREGVVEVVRA